MPFIFICLFSLLSSVSSASGQSNDDWQKQDDQWETKKTQTNHGDELLSNDKYDWLFSNKTGRPGNPKSSIFWLPLLSYIAPGSGQYIHGQTHAGLVYTGIAGVGLVAASRASLRLEERGAPQRVDDFDSFDPDVRRYMWGLKTYDLAGSLSLYHAFQTSLNLRKQRGEYAFLPKEAETTDELMLAPFEFSNLGRWSTILPLVLGTGLVIWSGATDDYDTRSLDNSDIVFSSAISYNAGVGEEALFRGWMFPMFAELYGVENIFWANLTQAAIFGAAHLSGDNPFPAFQTVAGFYFGWLAQKNGWSLRESIFVHTWWDVIIFTAAFTQKNQKAKIYIPLYQTHF